MQYKIKKGLPPSKAEAADLNAFLTGARQAQLSPGVFQQDVPTTASATKQQAAFERLRQSIEANPEHRALVYSNYLDAGLNPYRAMLDKHKIPYAAFTGEMPDFERQQAVRDYNEGKLRALLVSSAGGEGLDLKGTRQIQLLEPHFNAEKLKQVIGRGIRYQSHAGLPEDQRNVSVEQYLSSMPARQGLAKMIMGPADMTADQYLHQMGREKEQLNEQLRSLLRNPRQQVA
jgi:superfamily II DNA/RNA helicase